jgi:hypothetical protein
MEVVARPQPTDATAKTRRPISIAFFRPKRSAKLPEASNKEA